MKRLGMYEFLDEEIRVMYVNFLRQKLGELYEFFISKIRLMYVNFSDEEYSKTCVDFSDVKNRRMPGLSGQILEKGKCDEKFKKR
jgi:hypothetical protein